jgi:hypothetical protein
MRQLSDTFSKVETPPLLPTNAPQNAPQAPELNKQGAEGQWVQ